MLPLRNKLVSVLWNLLDYAHTCHVSDLKLEELGLG